MATLVFTAIGAQLGGSMLGGVIGAGLGATIGQAVGGGVGRFLDQKLFGETSKPQKTKPVEMMRITTAHHGAPMGEYWGRNRVAGHIIWSGGFRAKKTKNGYKYYASFALALGIGEVHRIGRVWYQSKQIQLPEGKWRLHKGDANQEVDPLIASHMGEGQTPAYRGVAYIVFDDLELTEFYNRIPDLQFEIFRQARNTRDEYRDLIRGVAMIPGSGEYVYATRAVEMQKGQGKSDFANKTRPDAPSDFIASLEDLQADLPNCNSISLITSWFGDDLRLDECKITPRVEQNQSDGDLHWQVSGVARAQALMTSQIDGSPAYGGTPDDRSVIDAIQAMKQRGFAVMFYPFILMDIPLQNGLPDPYGAQEQPVNPWRGRITLADADFIGTRFAQAPVEQFLGNADISDFSIDGDKVVFAGADEWGYRRFILHYAFLCKLAGGVDEFLIGSELRGLTQIRGEGANFPFVDGLVELAKDVREILAANTKIGYAADWSEYFGYAPKGENGTIYFHLDKLWACDDIDFIGIDNYMPISDWRYSASHQDAEFGSIYALDYLQSNIEGGEGFDWFYENQNARDEQIRTPILDAQGEPWIWRYKDIHNWWRNRHYHRIEGARMEVSTDWEPCSKPIYFTEFGSAATDISTNQPNKFIDPKSSESSLAYYSEGKVDPYIQLQYAKAITVYWQASDHNPISNFYHDCMLDCAKFYLWCWDARPWPEFPMRDDLWSDAANFQTGHWINGRVNAPSLANIVSEICAPLGAANIDVAKLYGQATGIAFHGDETIGEKLEALMKAYQFDIFYKDRKLHFVSRGYASPYEIEAQYLVSDEKHQKWQITKTDFESTPARFEMQYVSGEANYDTAVAVSHDQFAKSNERALISTNFTFGADEAENLAQIYHRQSALGSEKIVFQMADIQPVKIGDIIQLKEASARNYMVERVTSGAVQEIGAFAIHQEKRSLGISSPRKAGAILSTALPWVEWLDLPMGGKNTLNIYASHQNWPGEIAFLMRSEQTGKELKTASLPVPSCMGVLQDGLAQADANRRQNIDIQVAFNRANFEFEMTQYCPYPLFAIGDLGAWEIIAAEQCFKISKSQYALGGLYRGMFGTQVMAHEEGAKIISISSDCVEILGSDFDNFSSAELEYGLASTALDLNKSATISAPNLAEKPLAPVQIEQAGDQLNWLPRQQGDYDFWADEEGFDPLKFRIEIYSGENSIATHETSQTQFHFGDYLQNDNLKISIQAINARGLASEKIVETI